MFTSINPATGATIATHPELTPDEVEAKLAAAARASAQWRTTAIETRTGLLERLADEYDLHKHRLARVATDEMGKTLAAAVAEVEKCAGAFRHYARHGPAMLVPERVTLAGGGTAETVWLPLGPVLAVMPWNFPFWQVVRFLAPTILAGNVALLKHAENVQGVAALIEEMALAAGAPEGLVQNVPVRPPAVAALIADDRVAAVTLTGSERAGMAVAEQAGRHLKKAVLELGGSDPFIVMRSADLDTAVREAVRARLQNAGQSCICGKRMIVEAAVYDAFAERFAAAMAAVKVGDPTDPETEMGPLSSATQRDAVLAQIAEARRAGAMLTGGGQPAGPGAFLLPGILTDLPRDSAVAGQEIFGPIATLYRVADLDEAIAVANDTPFGLGSSVWTNDRSEQDRFVRDLEAGMTAINEVLASSPEVPFGGIKRSGYGRELGAFGLHEFMNLKTVLHAPAAATRAGEVE